MHNPVACCAGCLLLQSCCEHPAHTPNCAQHVRAWGFLPSYSGPRQACIQCTSNLHLRAHALNSRPHTHLLRTTTDPSGCTSCCMYSAANAAGLSRCANQRASVHLACTGRNSHCSQPHTYQTAHRQSTSVQLLGRQLIDESTSKKVDCDGAVLHSRRHVLVMACKHGKSGKKQPREL